MSVRPPLALLAAAAETADPTAIDLAQYGAIGTLLVTFLWFAFRAWKRETDRSDRLEVELRETVAKHQADISGLHASIQEKAIPALLASANAMAEVTELLRDLQTERRTEYARTRREGM